MVNVFIVYEINLWDHGYDDYPRLENCLFGAVKLVKNADIDKYKYSGRGIGFDRNATSSTGGFYKNVIIFRVEMSSSLNVNNKGKYILILGDGPTRGLDDTASTAEKEFSINFTESRKKFCLSLNYNGANSYLIVNATNIYQFKEEDSQIKKYPLCLGNISKEFSLDNMKKTPLKGYAYDFSVDYFVIDTSNIINIHQYLMKKHDIK